MCAHCKCDHILPKESSFSIIESAQRCSYNMYLISYEDLLLFFYVSLIEESSSVDPSFVTIAAHSFLVQILLRSAWNLRLVYMK